MCIHRGNKFVKIQQVLKYIYLYRDSMMLILYNKFNWKSQYPWPQMKQKSVCLGSYTDNECVKMLIIIIIKKKISVKLDFIIV